MNDGKTPEPLHPEEKECEHCAQEGVRIKGPSRFFRDPVVLSFSACHRMPSRSFFWRGRQFPVCARCTGIHVGYLTMPLFLFSVWTLSLGWTIALMLPTYIDGSAQAFLGKESNNRRRFITGLLSGVGLMSLVSIIGKYIGDLILLWMK